MNTVPEAFAAWVSPHLPAMARLAARLAPDADRDDVVQEALVRAWTKRHQYDDRRGSPSAWLLAITADQARKARSRVTKSSRLLSTVDSGKSAPVSDDGVDLRRALAQLTDRQRLAVDCVYFAGLSVAETAAVMRCAEGTVKSTLSDARAKLRVLLEVIS
ncbi:RNA polymerase sigma factor [Lentzea tibetensis]|uniref:RNA polymerase sigma factor n=1 Tax=Lentzea tibetensis TaxID=2591470 RepID=A0A563EPD6_9PSEU|nr:RNA polymerase sigma factor [Lentzea tibetensis]TWP49075.1 RNA polymerase sigma factor [Lentzea tibetensis]